MGFVDLEKVFDHIFQGVLNGGCSSVWDIRPTVADSLVPVQPMLKAWCALSVISRICFGWVDSARPGRCHWFCSWCLLIEFVGMSVEDVWLDILHRHAWWPQDLISTLLIPWLHWAMTSSSDWSTAYEASSMRGRTSESEDMVLCDKRVEFPLWVKNNLLPKVVKRELSVSLPVDLDSYPQLSSGAQ